jgi:hypothetical protein
MLDLFRITRRPEGAKPRSAAPLRHARLGVVIRALRGRDERMASARSADPALTQRDAGGPARATHDARSGEGLKEEDHGEG